MLAPLLALAMILSLHQSLRPPARPAARFISNARWDEAEAILAKAPHPVNVRFVYIGKLDPDASDTYFFFQILSIFSQAKNRCSTTGVAEMSEQDAGPDLGHGIGCSAIHADGDSGKIISGAMAAMGYPCSHEAAGYSPPSPPSLSGRRPLIPRLPIQEVVISIGR
jgi:hypothetical protein